MMCDDQENGNENKSEPPDAESSGGESNEEKFLILLRLILPSSCNSKFLSFKLLEVRMWRVLCYAAVGDEEEEDDDGEG